MDKLSTKQYSFFVNEIPGNGDPGHIRFLFNNPKYLQLHPLIHHDVFYILNEKENKIEGRMIFQYRNDSVISVYKGTFGSLEICGKLNYDVVYNFINFIIRHFEKKPVSSIIIRHYADIYDPLNGPVIALTLSHAGFQVKTHDINHHLPVTGNLFEEHLNKMEKRKLKKCIEEGLKFHRCRASQAESVVKILNSYRKKKNIPPSMTLPDLKNYFENMPSNYFLFYAADPQGEIEAGAVMVKTAEGILYYFSPASNPMKKSLSPMVFLIKGIYEFAAENRFRYIDLGVSSVENTPQKGLIRFKENIGGISSSRFTFRLELQ